MPDDIKSIALELLEKYKKSEETCIWEYSFCIEEDVRKLEAECLEYGRKIEKACKN